MLLDLRRTEEAAAAAERALALNPTSPDTVNLMGRIAFERDHLEEALAHYRRALSLKPDLADAYNNMGNVLKEVGSLAEAEKAYLTALELDPAVAGVYVNLADSRKFAPGDQHLAAELGEIVGVVLFGAEQLGEARAQVSTGSRTV